MMIHFNKISASIAIATVLMIFQACVANASVDSIKVGQELPRSNLLKEGVHHYLLYMKEGSSSMARGISTHEVRFETRDGKRLMQITQRLDMIGKNGLTKWLDSWFEAGTFKPISHQRITESDGKRTVEGFLFNGDKIIGMPELADNTQKDLNVASPESTFNFESDLEFLRVLSWKEAYEGSINFYHPGGKTAPTRYLFKVAGEEKLSRAGVLIDCWKVTTDYNRPGSVSTFWIAKQSQLILKLETPMPNGSVFSKVLID